MLLKFLDIGIGFNNREVAGRITFDVEEGDKLVLSGKSGSGKTSLILAIMGFVSPQSGSILFHGKALSSNIVHTLRDEVAYLPQQINFNGYSVRGFLELPFSFRRNQEQKPSEGEILDHFSTFDLQPSLLESRMQDISGGEKQRIALVSCLLLKRRILLLDEPTSALDKKVKNIVMKVLLEKEGLTIISASHDSDWVKRCDKVVQI